MNSLTVAGIGALFFPILREQSPNVAIAHVYTRVVEELLPPVRLSDSGFTPMQLASWY